MGALKTIAYMGLWAIGYIAVDSVTGNTMAKVQSFIGGQNGGV